MTMYTFCSCNKRSLQPSHLKSTTSVYSGWFRYIKMCHITSLDQQEQTKIPRFEVLIVVHTYIHTYIHTHTYIHMHIHVYINFTDPTPVIKQSTKKQVLTTQQTTHTEKIKTYDRTPNNTI